MARKDMILDDLALQCQKILNTEYSEKLDSCICREETVECQTQDYDGN